jgi:hypothetical protein
MAEQAEGKSAKKPNRSRRSPPGIQPGELTFVSVARPGERTPSELLSQITAHAMRKSHEQRRMQNGTKVKPKQPRKSKKTVESKDDTKTSKSSKAKRSTNARSSAQSEQPPTQQGSPAPMQTAEPEKARTHSNSSQAPSQPPATQGTTFAAFGNACTCALDEPCICEESQASGQALTALNQPGASTDVISGGYRVDPFLTYPIKFQDYFPQAVDYSKSVITPYPAFFEMMMTHDVLFESVLAFVLCTYLARTPELEKALLSHWRNAMRKVYQGVMSSGSTRTAVKSAISNLAGICVSCILLI